MTMRCDLCWTTFDSPVALLEHEALEDDRLYFVDGLVDEEVPPLPTHGVLAARQDLPVHVPPEPRGCRCLSMSTSRR